MLSRSLRSAVQLAEVSLDQASWTALELLPQPWVEGRRQRAVMVPGAVSPGDAGLERRSVPLPPPPNQRMPRFFLLLFNICFSWTREDASPCPAWLLQGWREGPLENSFYRSEPAPQLLPHRFTDRETGA